jgi:hypothetical protein
MTNLHAQERNISAHNIPSIGATSVFKVSKSQIDSLDFSSASQMSATLKNFFRSKLSIYDYADLNMSLDGLYSVKFNLRSGQIFDLYKNEKSKKNYNEHNFKFATLKRIGDAYGISLLEEIDGKDEGLLKTAKTSDENNYYYLLGLLPLLGLGGGGGGGSSPQIITASTLTPTLTQAVYPSGWTSNVSLVTAPSVSAKGTAYSDGRIDYVERGTVTLPFLQTTLSARSIDDPNAYVTSSTATYDLRWGAPDGAGPSYASVYPNASNILSGSLSYAGISVAGQGGSNPTLLKPSADVLDAWNAGWTGKGVNVLTIDNFADKSTCTYLNGNCHGVVVMMNVDYIAPGTNKYGLHYLFTNNFTGVAFDSNGVNLTSPKSIKVINMSWNFTYSTNNWNCNNGCGVPPTDAVYNAGITSHVNNYLNLNNVLNGVTNVSNLSNFANAVIVQSAGNDALDSKYNLNVLSFSGNSDVQDRLLIVGALNKNGTISSPADKASYSNFAGANASISDRFVMANGTMPWSAGGVSINGDNFSVYSGTSFAAPLVAGYAAIVMQKFPNLDASKTSKIILDTARYDTLSCHPNCDPAIYGRGEASLSRALAPVGRLR